jgi:hypothetical protein
MGIWTFFCPECRAALDDSEHKLEHTCPKCGCVWSDATQSSPDRCPCVVKSGRHAGEAHMGVPT